MSISARRFSTFPSAFFPLDGIHSRNASLGHGDTNDRTHPEQVVLMHLDHPLDDPIVREKISFKLQAVLVWDVQLSRLHTGMVFFFPSKSISVGETPSL